MLLLITISFCFMLELGISRTYCCCFMHLGENTNYLYLLPFSIMLISDIEKP